MESSRRTYRHREPLWILALCLCLSSAGQAATTLTFSSDPTDFVGKGDSGTVTDADGTWTASSPNYSTFTDVRLSFDETSPGTDSWALEFAAPMGVELTPGTYLDAVRLTGQAQPYIRISHNGFTCGTGAGGDFTVSEVKYDVYGTPIRFAATFVQRCDNSDPGNPALTGTIDHTFDGTVGTATLTEGNVLVNWNNHIYEYTPGGTQVQVLPIGRESGEPPTFELSSFSTPARDLAMDAGLLHVFNNVSSSSKAWLSSFDPATGIWTHSQCDTEWNTIGGELNGAVAAFGRWVFANDMGFDASGIIRYDALNGYACQRFNDGQPYQDVVIGLDGRLYAKRDGSSTWDIFDPVSMSNLGSVSLTGLGAAVDEGGAIFTALSATLREYDQAGVLQNSLSTAYADFFDIDVSLTGQIVVGTNEFSSGDNDFIVSDTTLASASQFVVDPSTTLNPHTYVAFVQHLVSFLDGFESGDTSAWSSTTGAP